MSEYLRKPAQILVVTALLALPFAAPAKAVYCSNCGTEWTQLANNLQLAEQLVQQTEMVTQALKRYENMLMNTQGLGRQLFGNALADLRRAMGALEKARALSVSSGDLDARFAEKFKDFKSYLESGLGAHELGDKWQQWSQDTNSSVLSAMKAGQIQAEQITGNEDALFRDLEAMSRTSEGRMQAMQTANQIALAAARQTQKLRQLMLTNLQMQANYIQMQMDREAAGEAAWRSFIGGGNALRPGKGW